MSQPTHPAYYIPSVHIKNRNEEGININKRLIPVIVLTAAFILVVLFVLSQNLLTPGGTPVTADGTGQDQKVEEQLPPEANLILEKPVIINGDFEQGGLGWSNPMAVEKDDSGNHYIINNNSWEVRQDMDLLPYTTYEINLQTKKGTAEGPARIVFTFHDINGKKMSQFYDIKYTHLGADWEDLPHQFITIPQNAAITRIYLLTNDPNGFHYFDNIVITRTGEVGDRKSQNAADEDELIINGNFELGLYGWIGVASLIVEEENNRLLKNGYNWEAFQQVSVIPEQTYVLAAETRAGAAGVPARIKITFMDSEGHRTPEFYNILHLHKTTDWENTIELIEIPPDVQQIRIYLLADDPLGNGKCDFDHVSLIAYTGQDVDSVIAQNRDRVKTTHGYQEENVKYVVKEGDTVASIADLYGIDVMGLIDFNNIIDPNRIEVGQILYIPAETEEERQ